MLTEKDFPILEYDDDPEAPLSPACLVDRPFSTDKLIITFFPDVINTLLEAGALETERIIAGENPVTIYRFTEEPDILITLGHVGCPACAGDLDLFCAMGAEKVMFCGGGGVLDREIMVGQLLLVDGAIRDEGFSYHYLKPSRYVYASDAVNAKISAYLDAHGVPYLKGLSWTTDAIFRETRDKVLLRRREGALIVEMEQAGCLAVAQCRGLAYGAIIYGGDDVSGTEWSQRDWRSRNGIRFDLVNLCRKLVREI